jgi:hypothetical protein
MAEQSAASVAINPAASADERFDAQVEMHRSGLGDLIPREDIQPIIDHIQETMADQEMAKALRKGNVIPFPESAGSKKTTGGQSVFLDDFQIVANGQYWDRPGLLGLDSMRAMVDQTPILSGIVLTRIRQVARFCRPQMNQADAGFVIGHVDQNHELAPAQQDSIALLNQFIINCGWERDPRKRKRLKRLSFSQFMSKSVRDSLCMDAAPIETEFKRDRSLGLDGFYPVDGATIRLCSEEGYEGDDEIFALQVVQGRIRTAYTYDDLVYEVRNPRTDVTACGYGLAEVEMLVRVVTYFLNAMTYNGSFFDKNAIPRGILQIYGNYSQNDTASFKRYWNSMVKGVSNVHNMPVLVSKDQESGANYTEIGGQLDEMAFGRWLSFLTSLSSAIFGISPEEISMESFSTGKSALSGDDTEEKIVSSTDKGLRPLLGYYENTISDFILQVFSPEYNFRFVGLDTESSQNRFEMRKLVATLNEARKDIGMDAIEGPIGDIPLNPSLIPPWQAITGVGQPEQDFGDPSAAGGDAPPGGPPGGEDDDSAPDMQDGAEQAAGPDYGSPDDGDGPDHGAPPPMAKAMAGLDFGFPPIYQIED